MVDLRGEVTFKMSDLSDAWVGGHLSRLFALDSNKNEFYIIRITCMYSFTASAAVSRKGFGSNIRLGSNAFTGRRRVSN